jgi:chaperone required for assembly of F1-ATPase
MADWEAKRFWKAALAVPEAGGYTVHLDGRAVHTPAKRPLIVPTAHLAGAIAAEWDAQHDRIRPETMPHTRAANSAIDKVAPLAEAVIDELSGYGGTDLLCYRATGPVALIARQAAAWNPVLDWARDTLGAPLVVTAGVIPVPQPQASLSRLRAHVAAHSAFHLAALHDLVAISGSLVLALAVARRHMPVDDAFAASRIDEAWQAEQWGADTEAAAVEAVRAEAFASAGRFFALCG